ncbi:hypothetical protein F4677DRAFT_448128 [Hypoxylon crocopeplum]|nr:hypothetical protein F4677DRAFT_448128 [Hypoxylon crocopeplum]
MATAPNPELLAHIISVSAIRNVIFEADRRRFRWVGAIGVKHDMLYVRIRALTAVNRTHATNGTTADDRDVWKHFIVMRPLGRAVARFEDEVDRLRVFQGAQYPHIMQKVDLPGNPLNQGARPYGLHMVLENVENGTLGDFIRKAREEGITRLPEGLLMGLFRCLLQATMEMVGIGQFGDREEHNFVHPNLTLDNVWVGTCDDQEHTLDHRFTPTLKVTGFGRSDPAEPRFANNQSEAMQRNLMSVGMIMQSLIMLTDDERGHFQETGWVRFGPQPERMQVYCTSLIQGSLEDPAVEDHDENLPFPWLSLDLRYSICRIAAVDPVLRRDIIPILLNTTWQGLSNVSAEEVDEIKELLSKLLHSSLE